MEKSAVLVFALSVAGFWTAVGVVVIAVNHALVSTRVAAFFRETVWLSPNALSVARLPMGLALAWTVSEQWTFAGLLLLGCGIVSDVLDGLVARATDRVSETGKWLDPFMDKILYLPPLFVFAASGMIDWTLLAILAFADIAGTLARPILRDHGIRSKATNWGKAKTGLVFFLMSILIIIPETRLEIPVFPMMIPVMQAIIAGLSLVSVVSKLPR